MFLPNLFLKYVTVSDLTKKRKRKKKTLYFTRILKFWYSVAEFLLKAAELFPPDFLGVSGWKTLQGVGSTEELPQCLEGNYRIPYMTIHSEPSQ